MNSSHARSLYRTVYRASLPLHDLYRRRLFARARDLTSVLAAGSALVIAPHPDDDILGCGALIARKRAHGASVRVVFATSGGASHPASAIEKPLLVELRRREALDALARLQVPASDVGFLEFEDGDVPASEQALANALAEEIAACRPAQVYACSLADFHPDHASTARAARRAASIAGFDGLFYEYPVWYWRHLPWTHQPHSPFEAARYALVDPIAEALRARAHAVSTDGYLELKRAALAEHSSQVVGLNGEAAPLESSFVEEFFGPAELFFRVPQHRLR